MQDIQFKMGKYRHYRNRKLYEILAVGRHTENMEPVVVYKGLYTCDTFGPNPIWIRPVSMFMETVDHEGTQVPRFEFIESAECVEG